ncbi:MAG: LamG domain-containing protein [Vulcanimicrobiaceae bacterium]
MGRPEPNIIDAAYHWSKCSPSGHRHNRGITVTAGKWHHVANTYDVTSGNRAIYLDGNRVANDTAFPFTGNTVGTIGQGVGTYWPGKIDDMRLYNRALSATEVKQLYNAGR